MGVAAIGIVAIVMLVWFASGVRIINEYQNGVVLRLGRFVGLKTAGFKWIIPFVDRIFIVDLRTTAEQVPPQDVITKDNVSLKVSAVLYFRVIQADRAVLQVNNFLFATSQVSQTTLRSVLGQVELDELLSQREKINRQLAEIIDRHTEPWGIKVASVEVKQIDLPQEMQRVMARQAEADRERRAKIIAAEGEHQAAEQLAQAAVVISRAPGALQLRYLQTLVELSTEKTSTIVFPFPIELIRPFLEAVKSEASPPIASVR
jgi:regulator of protease activity HflC (stomatin/prohibitin superfamily)